MTLLLAVGARQGAAQAVNLTRYRLVDLTHTFGPRTLYWPTATTGFKLDQLSFGQTPGGYFYSSYAYSAPEHGGTHLDAPIHFSQTGLTAERIPVSQFIGPAVVIDVSKQAAADPDYRLTPADVRAWERTHGRIPRGAMVVLRTGWAMHWPNAKRYFGDDGDASTFISATAPTPRGCWCRSGASRPGRGRRVHRLWPSKDFIVHQIAARANVIGLRTWPTLGAAPWERRSSRYDEDRRVRGQCAQSRLCRGRVGRDERWPARGASRPATPPEALSPRQTRYEPTSSAAATYRAPSAERSTR
jgi:kynurenine formamidase